MALQFALRSLGYHAFCASRRKILTAKFAKYANGLMGRRPRLRGLFESNSFAFPVEGGLIHSEDLSGFGEVGGSVEDSAKVRFFQLLHGNQGTNLQRGVGAV